MDYIQGNKEAWEEAFDRNKEGYGKENIEILKNEHFPFLQKDLVEELQKFAGLRI